MARDNGDSPSSVRREGIAAFLIGAILLFGFSFWATVQSPSQDEKLTETTQAGDAREKAADEETFSGKGRKVYIREGCYTCHTQEVRPVVADEYLGAVSVAGDYAGEDSVPLGNRRVGPDLTHVGSREVTKDQAALVEKLKDPQHEVTWSTMPSYSYLPEEDLENLAAYLASLK